MASRNPYPKGAKVTFHCCEEEGCSCRIRGQGTEGPGLVLRALGKLIAVEFESAYEGVMSRVIHFRKDTAPRHLTLLCKRKRKKTTPP